MINNEKDVDKENLIKSLLISDYFFTSGFRQTFKESKRIKEMFLSIEATITLLFTFIVVLLLSLLFLNNSQAYVNLTSNLIVAMIGGFISLIAFSLAALTLTLSFINNKEILRFTKLTKVKIKDEYKLVIENEDYLQTYRDISFRFYHSAFFNFVSIVILLATYVFINLSFEINLWLNVFLGSLVVYFILYSLIFNITLVNDCIKMKFSNFEY